MSDSNTGGRGQAAAKEGRSTLIGLVRKLSRSGKGREGRQGSVRVNGEAGAYKRVDAGSSTAGATGAKERIIWGPPPANVGTSNSRTVEGVQLADNGPQSVDAPLATSPPPYSTVPPVPPGRTSSRANGLVSGTLPDRRSIDSLFSSMDLPAPLASTSHERRFTSMRGKTPQRSASCRTSGPGASAISSTARAKPARESVLPLHQSSPFNGYWTTGRSWNTSADIEEQDEESIRMRDKFKGLPSVWTVSRGWKKGVFSSFEEAEQQTRGFPGPVIRKFDTVDEAMHFLKTTTSSPQPGKSLTCSDEIGQHQRRSPGPSQDRLKRNVRSTNTNPFRSDLQPWNTDTPPVTSKSVATSAAGISIGSKAFTDPPPPSVPARFNHFPSTLDFSNLDNELTVDEEEKNR